MSAHKFIGGLKPAFFLCGFLIVALHIHAQQLYELPPNSKSRLSSFENLNGEPANGGKTNKTAKGNAFEMLEAGGTKTLLDIKGQGVIQRIWMTIDQNPVKLRSLRLQMFWDGESKPAVDVPMGDFFVYNIGRKVAFESALFSTGEGRSFNCFIPMPFRKAAKIILVNEGKEAAKLFFDVDFVLQPVKPADMYFHACWSRQTGGKLGDDVVILPTVKGKGRFLGMSVGLITDPAYEKSWWGEGEVKMYMDGDGKYPTINGTGAEDYIGSAWGLGKFTETYQGCTVADDSLGRYNFYRWHVPDAVYFNQSLKVTLQQLGGWMKADVIKIMEKGAKLQPVTIDSPGKVIRLLDIKETLPLKDASLPEGWVNFYRLDDYAAVGYFYLNQPSSNLPALAPVTERIAGL